MNTPQHIAVIDIGKTNAKLALVDLETLTELAVITRPNIVQPGPPWPHFDVDGHWAFLLNGLAQFHQSHRIDAISIATHGACVALLDGQGDLAAPILDYEHQFPDDIATGYGAIRPAFADTGTPSLIGGLNIGAQLYYQFETDPTLHKRTRHIVGYPQYWGHRLTGIAANDLTTMGCHTDLWEPMKARLSSLPTRLNIADKIAPVRKSGDILGTLLPEVAAQTGLPATTPVVCGIHDSNASLYPHLLARKAPFSVASTGTWVITMAIGGHSVTIDPARDTLINVNALGDPTPSGRFMGGREFELIQQGYAFDTSDADVELVLDRGPLLLPAVEPTSGPFQNRKVAWVGDIPPIGSGERSVALSYYLALMTGVCLTETGADGPTIVEGPFARNPLYLDMLGTVTDRPVVVSQSATGTSIGAALLFGTSGRLEANVARPASRSTAQLKVYAQRWHLAVGETFAASS